MAQENKDILPEKWMKGVAITTTVLAVCASIAGSRSSVCVAQNQLLTALEGSTWAYYQAKSIKQTMMEIQQKTFEADTIGNNNAEQKAFIDKELKTSAAEIKRYGKEKDQIKKDAEGVAARNAVVGERSSQFTLSVVFFQIGIMLSSVSVLVKRKEMWVAGVVFGLIGLFFLANGLLLFAKVKVPLL
jgi:hypothetical protein